MRELALMPCMVRLLLSGVHSMWPGSHVYLYSSRSWGNAHLLLQIDCCRQLNKVDKKVDKIATHRF